MRRTILTTVSLTVLAAALSGVSGTAQAADLGVYTKAPPPVVDTWSPWQIRVRALGVLPDSNNSSVHVLSGTAAQQALSSPASSLSFSDQVVPELDISYFFSKNLAAELILGVTRHSITGTGALDGLPIGKTTLLPPTLMIQYHFTNFGAFQPYVGVGVNYTTAFDTKAAAPTTTHLSIGDSFGAAAQIGFDYMIDQHWGFNVDAKRLWVRPEYNATVTGLPVAGTAHIDPWLIGVGVTYRF